MGNATSNPGSDPAARTATQLARRDKLLGPSYRLFYDEPLHVVRGEGAFLYDREGRAYLDAYNNVPCVGHCNSRVTAAVAEQMTRLNTHTRYLEDRILDYAENLLARLGGRIAHVHFTCTGSEANDLAARIAMHKTGRRGFVVTRWAYHGNSHLTAGFSPALGDGYPGGADVRFIPAPDPREIGGEDLTERLVAELDRTIQSLQADGGPGFSALILDSLFSSDGIFPQPEGLLQSLAELTRKEGGLIIADEVQSGFGRCGKRFWGFERHGVEPDIVTMGKPMGNGYPIGATAVTAEVVAAFGRQTRYFNTFGGNPVAIAAAEATLDVLDENDLPGNARRTGALLESGLRDLSARYPVIGEVRAAGLYLGVDIRDPASGAPDPARAKEIVNRMKRAGVLISTTGRIGDTLKIRPPLIFDAGNADQLLSTFEQAVARRDP